MEIGETIALQFDIIRKLEGGGMGDVWLANDNGSLGHVVLKNLKKRFASDKSLRLRFQREARILRDLHHENIIQIYFADLFSDPPFFVMEYCEGGSIREALPNLNFQQAIEYFIQACKGVSYAHKKDIVHRDLKPDNLLLDGEGTVRVSDFGLAVDLERATQPLTPSGAGGGTDEYMAPEQRSGLKDVDKPADVYPLGIILLELLSGAYPSNAARVLEADIHLRHPRISEDIVQRLVAESNKARQFSVADRHGSVEELSSAVREICHGM